MRPLVLFVLGSAAAVPGEPACANAMLLVILRGRKDRPRTIPVCSYFGFPCCYPGRSGLTVETMGAGLCMTALALDS